MGDIVMNLRAGFAEICKASRSRVMYGDEHAFTVVTFPSGDVYIRHLTAFPVLAKVLFKRAKR